VRGADLRLCRQAGAHQLVGIVVDLHRARLDRCLEVAVHVLRALLHASLALRAHGHTGALHSPPPPTQYSVKATAAKLTAIVWSAVKSVNV